jgi:hypothetical protein
MARFRNQHPDLDENGNLRADAFVPSRERDFDRDMRDPTAAAHFMAQVAREQSELPQSVQRLVQGRHYGGSPAEGYQEYLADRDWAMRSYAESQGYQRVVTDKDVADMSLQQYDELFDERGQPKPGVLLWRTSRSHVIDDGTNMRATRR